jgi:hypothetical protein
MRTRAGIALLAAALTLAGCAPDSPDQPSPPASPTGPGPTGEVGNVPPPSPTAPSTPAEPQTPADLIVYVLATPQMTFSDYQNGGLTPSFSTPSGNISCGLFGAQLAVLCLVKENSWPSVPDQACEDAGDWTTSSVAASGEGVKRGDCFSEQPFPMPGTVLPYGRTISDSFVACRSEPDFLACANLSTGNGFAISKTSYHTYGTVLT